jgi:hypothetical protein
MAEVTPLLNEATEAGRFGKDADKDEKVFRTAEIGFLAAALPAASVTSGRRAYERTR